jgi:hypothetical protein
MGKKPVLKLAGLVLASLVLGGCQTPRPEGPHIGGMTQKKGAANGALTKGPVNPAPFSNDPSPYNRPQPQGPYSPQPTIPAGTITPPQPMIQQPMIQQPMIQQQQGPGTSGTSHLGPDSLSRPTLESKIPSPRMGSSITPPAPVPASNMQPSYGPGASLGAPPNDEFPLAAPQLTAPARNNAPIAGDVISIPPQPPQPPQSYSTSPPTPAQVQPPQLGSGGPSLDLPAPPRR